MNQNSEEDINNKEISNMKTLREYIQEAFNYLLNDKHSWTKLSSGEYEMTFSDTVLFEMIPYKEYKLSKPENIILTIKREGPRWILFIKWKSDNNIYVCNGWKHGNFNIQTLMDESYEILNHLINSKTARMDFKEVILRLNNDINTLKNYDGVLSINDLYELIK